MALIVAGVDIVKPPTIYYNLHEFRNTLASSIGSNPPTPAESSKEPIYEMEPDDTVSVDSMTSPSPLKSVTGQTQVQIHLTCYIEKLDAHIHYVSEISLTMLRTLLVHLHSNSHYHHYKDIQN